MNEWLSLYLSLNYTKYVISATYYLELCKAITSYCVYLFFCQ